MSGFLSCSGSRVADPILSRVQSSPAPTDSNAAAKVPLTNSTTANNSPASLSDSSIPKKFTLSQDSADDKYKDVVFNHEAHALQNYSPDGKSQIACAECHHTDQPKSALKPPLTTSERDVVMTFETWKTFTRKVSDCRACHFQDTNVPEDKEIPSIAKSGGGRKYLNNRNAYHTNCGDCHEAAAAARPELRKKAGFAPAIEGPGNCAI